MKVKGKKIIKNIPNYLFGILTKIATILLNFLGLGSLNSIISNFLPVKVILKWVLNFSMIFFPPLAPFILAIIKFVLWFSIYLTLLYDLFMMIKIIISKPQIIINVQIKSSATQAIKTYQISTHLKIPISNAKTVSINNIIDADPKVHPANRAGNKTLNINRIEYKVIIK